MKKLALITAMLLIVSLSLSACSQAKSESEDSTLPVSTPQGFEDVTAPPEPETDESTDNVTDGTTDGDTSASPEGITTPEEAVAAAKAYLGDEDPDIGYPYSFSYDGMFTDNGTEYFKIRVSWFIEEQERYSLCGYLLVGADGTVTKYSW